MLDVHTLPLAVKLGQMLVTGVKGGEVSADFERLVKRFKLGNAILFKQNQPDFKQLEALCRSISGLIEAETEILPLISSDEEGGIVSRLPDHMAIMPSAMGQAAVGDTSRVRQAAKLAGRQLRGLGINFNLAPVLDVNSNPQNPVIGVRSYGADSETVSRFALAALEGYRDAGVMACGKHFPGHGDTNVDSHLALPVIDKSMEALEAVELTPFRAAIAAGLPAITIAHICFPALEPGGVPATMSRAIVTGLLREEMGFDGLIISDCLEMSAIRDTVGVAKGAVEAVSAGIDLIYICHTPQSVEAAFMALKQAVESGVIPMARIDDAVTRILRAKAQYCQPAEPLTEEETAVIKAFALDFYRDVIAAGASTQAPFKLGANPLFIAPLPAGASLVESDKAEARGLAASMCRRFGGESYVPAENPADDEIEALAARASGHSAVVVATNNLCAHPGRPKLVRALAATGTPLAWVALRGPFGREMLPPDIFTMALYEYSPRTISLAMEHFIS